MRRVVELVWVCRSEQIAVYDHCVRPLVEDVLDGYNGTVFAYGQTGSGKTFTMQGDASVPHLRGVIPNAYQHIFNHIAMTDREENKTFIIKVSYIEIYMERIRDLISGQCDLGMSERDGSFVVNGLSERVVHNEEEIDAVMKAGNAKRKVASTKMNSVSSRSHSIFTITIQSFVSVPGQKEPASRTGKLHLVDLAGSERQKNTGAVGERLDEAIKINASLSALGNVIRSLVDGGSHIPYRSSKLTRLLKDSLGGNSKTLMIAAVSPADKNADQTLSTLRYANDAKRIKNKAVVNENPKDAALRKMAEEMAQLKDMLERMKRGEDVDRNLLRALLQAEADGQAANVQAVKKVKKKKKKKKGKKRQKVKKVVTKVGDDGVEYEEEVLESASASEDEDDEDEDEENIDEHEKLLRELEKKSADEKEAYLKKMHVSNDDYQKILAELEERKAQEQPDRQIHDLEAKLAKIQGYMVVGGERVLEKATQLEQENKNRESYVMVDATGVLTERERMCAHVLYGVIV